MQWEQGIGDDDDAVASSSLQLRETEEGFQPVFFDPRDLTNLALIDEMESLCPLMDMKVGNFSCLRTPPKTGKGLIHSIASEACNCTQ